MEFLTTLKAVLIMFFYMIPPYILKKRGKAEAPHAKTVSALLLYVSFPAMIINSFQTMEFSWNILGKVAIFFLVTMGLLVIAVIICYLILFKKFDDAKYRMLTIASSFGNVGFLGTPLITSLYPNSTIVACYSSIYTTSMTIMAFTIGVYALTTNKQYMSLFSALYNQATISLAIGIILYLAEYHFPSPLDDAVALLAKTSTPLCMQVLGIRLASVDFFGLFKRPFAYITTFIKLIVFPLIAYLLVRFIPYFDEEFKASILILSGAPSAAVILSLAELYNCEQELSANVVLVSTLLCIISLPFLTFILEHTLKK